MPQDLPPAPQHSGDSEFVGAMSMLGNKMLKVAQEFEREKLAEIIRSAPQVNSGEADPDDPDVG